jgi:hypothetical protein
VPLRQVVVVLVDCVVAEHRPVSSDSVWGSSSSGFVGARSSVER